MPHIEGESFIPLNQILDWGNFLAFCTAVTSLHHWSSLHIVVKAKFADVSKKAEHLNIQERYGRWFRGQHKKNNLGCW